AYGLQERLTLRTIRPLIGSGCNGRTRRFGAIGDRFLGPPRCALLLLGRLLEVTQSHSVIPITPAERAKLAEPIVHLCSLIVAQAFSCQLFQITHGEAERVRSLVAVGDATIPTATA